MFSLATFLWSLTLPQCGGRLAVIHFFALGSDRDELSIARLLDWSLIQWLLFIMASTASVRFVRVLDSNVFSLHIDEMQGQHILPTNPSPSLSTSLTLTSMSNSERRSATSLFWTGSALLQESPSTWHQLVGFVVMSFPQAEQIISALMLHRA